MTENPHSTGSPAIPTETANVAEVRALIERAWEEQYAHPLEAHAAAQRALKLTQEARDTPGQAWSHLSIGYYRLRYGEPTAARRSLDEALALFLTLGDRRGCLLASNGLARVKTVENDIEGALAIFHETLADTTDALTTLDRFYTLNGISGCYAALGDAPKALGYLFEALGLLRNVNARPQLATLLCNLGAELIVVGDYEEALKLLREAEGLAAELRHPRLSLGVRSNLADCLANLGRAQEALPLARQIIADPETPLISSLESSIYQTAALVFVENEQWDDAQDALGRAEETARRYGNNTALASALWTRGVMQARLNDVAAALATQEAARAALEPRSSIHIQCRIQEALAQLYERAGRHAEAYASHREFFKQYEARLGLAARARYFAVQIRFELSRMRDERDTAERQRRQSEEAKAKLETLNAALQDKILRIEELQSELKEQAVRDPLTNLYNRRYLSSVLADLVALAKRTEQPLAVAMLDLDQFKRVNDVYGHPFGDHVLATLSRLLEDHTRASDIVCRYGGEEFCVVFPHTEAVDAHAKIEDLLARLAARSIERGACVHKGVTFSAGVAAFPAHGATPEDVIAAADRALYDAKQSGRARVHTAVPV